MYFFHQGNFSYKIIQVWQLQVKSPPFQPECWGFKYPTVSISIQDVTWPDQSQNIGLHPDRQLLLPTPPPLCSPLSQTSRQWWSLILSSAEQPTTPWWQLKPGIKEGADCYLFRGRWECCQHTKTSGSNKYIFITVFNKLFRYCQIFM